MNRRINGLMLWLLTMLVLVTSTTAAAQTAEQKRWEKIARGVTITRDIWGIAHVSGKTDADAVFGAMYAQAEDDLNRIETNYLNSTGRLAEAEGESAVWTDLRQRLFMDPVKLKKQYDQSPAWLKKLMNAWADGLNYYLYRHPEVRPRVITRYEPWMPLTFSEGSIGGDIESISPTRLKAFYEQGRAAVPPVGKDPLAEPTGSNGIAIAPKLTADGNALLLINPHTSFFFRSELQMTSREGLNAYGAATWGQFFIYQGFNENLGWMHTSSAVDAIDEFLETVFTKNGKYHYRHGKKELLVTEETIAISVKTSDGMSTREFNVYKTHHGPIIRSEGDKWVAVSLMHEPVKALMQSYGRTKARNYKEFKKIMELQANSSNNTLYADKDGNIAYFHTNYIPKRDTKFDWTRPVVGSDPATDYKGLHTIEETPHLLNPPSGWVYNANDWPWAAGGKGSLKQDAFPRYVDVGVESARGRHAVMMLEGKSGFTLDSLIQAAYDSYLPWFETTLPRLLKAWEAMPPESPERAELAGPIEELRKWDMRWSTSSIPTSLAVLWAENIVRKVGADARHAGFSAELYVAEHAAAEALIAALAEAKQRLERDFRTWRTPWGEINRFQRLTGDIVHPFDDDEPSIPVGFTSGNWGSLASFGARPYKGSRRYYGTSGNSFVAVVEFGKRVKAKAVTAGGQSGDPSSPHFHDQAQRYASGDLRDVYFYPDDIRARAKVTYRPGIKESDKK